MELAIIQSAGIFISMATTFGNFIAVMALCLTVLVSLFIFIKYCIAFVSASSDILSALFRHSETEDSQDAPTKKAGTHPA